MKRIRHSPHWAGVKVGCAGFAALLLLLAPVAGAEMTQKGNLRVAFTGKVSPHALPRQGSAPIAVTMSGRIATTDGGAPPALQSFQIALNRVGRLDYKGLPTCTLSQIQPSTTAAALKVCGPAQVGQGSFSAAVSIPEQSPFPSRGKLIAFNGVQGGRPVIFAHVYGTEPIPTSFTLPLKISHVKGRFGAVFTGSLPNVASSAASVTGISLNLRRTYSYRGERRSYLSAGCSAPEGVNIAIYPFARASFRFDDGRTLRSSLARVCKVR